ncbi:hypothetical protein acsn021_03910 [Anaerocolumna cellulosilytica]|uniref:Uncharacterized protein n=1 Tax=Anaerocolumna cellulosilytica TaxID=433286 RepID=A0A6S6QZV6_9FIRM|nr:hypothetical protein acsn021_03910 [Anaerocolumna cellulosilytica]
MCFTVAIGKKHVTNTLLKESSIHAVLQFSNSYQRDKKRIFTTPKNPVFSGFSSFYGSTKMVKNQPVIHTQYTCNTQENMIFYFTKSYNACFR